MVGVGVLRLVAQSVQQLHLDLEGRVGQLAEQLGLRDDFGGHQIQNDQVQRAHILVDGAILRHNEDVFAIENRTRRQAVGNFYRQEKHLFVIIMKGISNAAVLGRSVDIYIITARGKNSKGFRNLKKHESFC